MSVFNKIGNTIRNIFQRSSTTQAPRSPLTQELNKKFNIETQSTQKSKGTRIQRAKDTAGSAVKTVKSLFKREAKLPPQPPRNPPPIPTENTEGSRNKTASQNLAKEIAAKSKKDKTSTDTEATNTTEKAAKPAPAKKLQEKNLLLKTSKPSFYH